MEIMFSCYVPQRYTKVTKSIIINICHLCYTRQNKEKTGRKTSHVCNTRRTLKLMLLLWRHVHVWTPTVALDFACASPARRTCPVIKSTEILSAWQAPSLNTGFICRFLLPSNFVVRVHILSRSRVFKEVGGRQAGRAGSEGCVGEWVLFLSRLWRSDDSVKTL